MLDAATIGNELAAMVKAQFAPVLDRIEGRMSALEKRLDALPQPKDGKDADPASVAALVASELRSEIEAVKALIPAPEVPDFTPMIEAAVAEAVKAIPAPKDGEPGQPGVGLAGALIDRGGELVVTLTNGETKTLGPVVGRDGQTPSLPDIPALVKSAVAEIPRPKDGRDGVDGVGFDDLAFDYDGERGLTFRFEKGERVVEKSVTLPVVIDRGVYRADEAYTKGDAVTYGGSVWIAQDGTSDKPGSGAGWRLAVKAGRDGRDGVVKAAPDAKPLQLRGPKC